jgi:hypothetical protein
MLLSFLPAMGASACTIRRRSTALDEVESVMRLYSLGPGL